MVGSPSWECPPTRQCLPWRLLLWMFRLPTWTWPKWSPCSRAFSPWMLPQSRPYRLLQLLPSHIQCTVHLKPWQLVSASFVFVPLCVNGNWSFTQGVEWSFSFHSHLLWARLFLRFLSMSCQFSKRILQPSGDWLNWCIITQGCCFVLLHLFPCDHSCCVWMKLLSNNEIG